MTGWVELKRRAREWHHVLLEKSGGDPSASALLAAAEASTGISRVPCSPDDSLLAGAKAVFEPEMDTIWYDRTVEPEMAAFYQMHEYVHHRLHGGRWTCHDSDLDSEAMEEETPLGVARVESYNPRERSERECNVFAREVLLPSDSLRRMFLVDGKRASAIATELGVPRGMVLHQLTGALLVSDLRVEGRSESESGDKPDLDGSQREIAHWPGGPLLAEAGPGTGKTRTLVARVEHLLEQGVPASSMLALTFSNKAAEEMRSRVALAAPENAPQIWMGTFHAFGLEFLRKYGERIGVPADFAVLDPVDAMFLLEEDLPVLNLDHYRNLYDPVINLPSLLSAISRAKDELKSPAEYLALAAAMLERATTEEERVRAEKAAEVGRVYGIYQDRLERDSRFDFGDLIAKTVGILRTCPEVKEDVRRTYVHILVDEYQDVNHASGVLLREISGEGDNLWVVGDTRQSIYRFRGAAPSNVQFFERDFPKAERRALAVNYRSRPAVVDAFSSLARTMRATRGRPFTPWKPSRRDMRGEALLLEAGDLEVEVATIAEEMKRLKERGIPYREQAVLCRSHTTMARVASRLGEAGIPVLYLGDVFEREEIRDLLSLISLTCEGDGRGLVRVARFPEYDIPLDDVRILLEAARERGDWFPTALGLAQDLDGISERGREGLRLLASHVGSVPYRTGAWNLLSDYLLDQSSYLDDLAKDVTLPERQKRLAIYQFLQFAHAQRRRGGTGTPNPRRAFLDHVRRLEVQGDEKALRQVPEWAAGLEAVRVLTVHASKGLEFQAVFIPCVGKGIFPKSRMGSICPPPDGLVPSGDPRDGHEEEEECLLFVAASRARDYLCVSRASRYGVKNSNPPDILDVLRPHLRVLPIGSRVSVTAKPVARPLPPVSQRAPVVEFERLQSYLACPRKHYYESVLGLRGRRADNVYGQFHGCVHTVLRWLGNERAQGRAVDKDGAARQLEEAWSTRGPREHAYERIYRESADRMVGMAVGRLRASLEPLPTPTWEVPLRNGRIQLSPDFIERVTDSPRNLVHAGRFRTGRRPRRKPDDEIYALYQTALKREFGAAGRLRVVYLGTGEEEDLELSQRVLATRLDRVDAAIDGVLRSEFSPQPDDRACPRCAYYFICPAAEEA